MPTRQSSTGKTPAKAMESAKALAQPLVLWVGPALEEGGDLHKAITRKGWTLAQVTDEDQAMEYALSRRVDILIARERRRRGRVRFFQQLNRTLPGVKKIILLQEENLQDVITYTNDAGIDFVLSPPFTGRRVSAAIKRMWEEKREQEEWFIQSGREGEVFAELKAFKETLEKEVRARTRDLSRANKSLRSALSENEEKNQALTLLNESLRVQSTTDPLTGLFNRREFINRIRTEWGRFKRHGRPLSLIMLDIDHFKAVNDTLGHECGDTVLRGLGELIRNHRRAHDLCCRYGGEEFVLLLMETDQVMATHVAEELRNLVGNHAFHCGSQRVDVHISLGVVGSMENNPPDVDAFIKMADLAMYQAKNTGRNRSVVFKAEEEEAKNK